MSLVTLHPSESENAGKRSLGINAGLPSGFGVVVFTFLFILAESLDVVAFGSFGEERLQVYHQGCGGKVIVGYFHLRLFLCVKNGIRKDHRLHGHL